MGKVSKRGEEQFEFACRRETESPNAILVYDYATEEKLWIPFSQVHEMHFNSAGEGKIVVTAWIAKQKGLI